jgi:hypothetical protein
MASLLTTFLAALLAALTFTASLFLATAAGLLTALLTATLVLLFIVCHFSFLLSCVFVESEWFRNETVDL